MYYEIIVQYRADFYTITNRLIDHGIPFTTEYTYNHPDNIYKITFDPINLKLLHDKIINNIDDVNINTRPVPLVL